MIKGAQPHRPSSIAVSSPCHLPATRWVPFDPHRTGKEARICAAGALLRSVALPQPLLCVVIGLWEQAVYVGSQDGRIFEIGLVGQQNGSPAAAADSLAARSQEEWGVQVLAGHSGAVNSLAMTCNGYNLISGWAQASKAACDFLARERQSLFHGEIMSALP